MEEEAQFLHLLFETLSLRGSSRSIYQGGTGTAPGGSIGGAGMIDPEDKNKLGGPSIHLGGGGGTSLRGPQRPLLRSGKLKPGGYSASRRVGGFTAGAMSAARAFAAPPWALLSSGLQIKSTQFNSIARTEHISYRAQKHTAFYVPCIRTRPKSCSVREIELD